MIGRALLPSLQHSPLTPFLFSIIFNIQNGGDDHVVSLPSPMAVAKVVTSATEEGQIYFGFLFKGTVHGVTAGV